MTPLTDAEKAKLRQILGTAQNIDATIGAFSDKVQARQTGFTLWVKFERKADVHTALRMARLCSNPNVITALAERVLEADERITELEAALTEARDLASSYRFRATPDGCDSPVLPWERP